MLDILRRPLVLEWEIGSTTSGFCAGQLAPAMTTFWTIFGDCCFLRPFLELSRLQVSTLRRRISFSLSPSAMSPLKSPSHFASSPGADASRTPTFAGQRHKCTPLDTYHPTSRTSRATPFSESHVAGLALTLAVYRRIGATSVRSLSCFCFRLLPSTQRTCRVYIPPRPAFGQASK